MHAADRVDPADAPGRGIHPPQVRLAGGAGPAGPAHMARASTPTRYCAFDTSEISKVYTTLQRLRAPPRTVSVDAMTILVCREMSSMAVQRRGFSQLHMTFVYQTSAGHLSAVFAAAGRVPR
eukprot:gene18743-biopygen8421